MTEKENQTIGKTIDDVSEKVTKESAKMAKGVGARREKSSTEEKVSVILGIIILGWALWALKSFLWGIILLILGLLLVTGYFNTFFTQIGNMFTKKPEKAKKAEPKKEEKAAPEKKPASKKPAKK